MSSKILLLTLMSIIVFISPVALAQNKVVVIPLDSTPAPATSKLIFVTNQSWTGNVGGFSGADAKCNVEAIARGIKGTFQALLGISGGGRPETRSVHYPLEYRSLTGEYLQSGFHDLFSSSGVDNPVLPGQAVYAWTGLTTNGSASADDCVQWTSASGAEAGLAGYAEQASSQWVSGGGFNCSLALRLYCIEQ